MYAFMVHLSHGRQTIKQNVKLKFVCAGSPPNKTESDGNRATLLKGNPCNTVIHISVTQHTEHGENE